MRDAITSQFVSDYLPRFSTIDSQQPLKEELGSLTVSTGLQKYINHLTVLINRPPQIHLPAPNLHKDLIDKECVAISLMLPLQPPSIF